MPQSPEHFSERLIRHWYEPKAEALSGPAQLLLGALSGLYGLLWGLRSLWVAAVARPRRYEGVRVIAVGNLIAGGAGKTPTVIALALAMQRAGFHCGVILRGYKSEAEHGPARVVGPQDLECTPASAIGDEAWLACWRTGLPIAVGKDRFAALAALKAAHPDINVAILDDGLQQKSLACDQTILITDARGFGNGRLLPAGPLREPIGNLQRFAAWIHQETHGRFSQDAIASRHAMPVLRATLAQHETAWVKLSHWQRPEQWMNVEAGIAQFRKQKILACAGIAVPERFFALLEAKGLAFTRLPLADHDPQAVDHIMRAQQCGGFDRILMTEKDAVKFFARNANVPDNAWALRRDAVLDEPFLSQLIHGPQTS